MAKYTIKKGDNLTKIAKANNTTVSALMKANPNIKDKDKIYTGKTLTVPSKTSKKAEPAKKKEPAKKAEPKKTTEYTQDADLNATLTELYQPPTFSDYNIDYRTVGTPQLRTASELASMLGIDYNQGNMQNTLNQATDAQYNELYKQQGIAEDKYYDNLASNQDALLSTLRNNQGQAMMSGLNKGMQAANELSALLGVSQQSVDEATLLAQERGLLADQYGADIAANASLAMDKYNNLGTQFGTLGHQLYSDEISQQLNDITYNDGVNQTLGSLQAQRDATLGAYQQTYTQSIGDLINQAYAQKAAAANSAYYGGGTVSATKTKTKTKEKEKTKEEEEVKKKKTIKGGSPVVTPKSNFYTDVAGLGLLIPGAQSAAAATKAGVKPQTGSAKKKANAVVDKKKTTFNTGLGVANYGATYPAVNMSKATTKSTAKKTEKAKSTAKSTASNKKKTTPKGYK